MWSKVRAASLIAAFAAFSVGATAQAGASARTLLSRPAPDFTRQDLSGNTLHLGALRGKVVLLNFWATWCAPCQVEMPTFNAWQHQYGPRGFAVVGISMDDDAADARRVVLRLKLDYPNSMGDARLGRLYGGVLGLPLTFLIDRNGIVRARFQGETDKKTIEKGVQALLSEPTSPNGGATIRAPQPVKSPAP
jgi:cytochrome c biogenesis protein CcmG/thiol:disulfide interchange protein DsbE